MTDPDPRSAGTITTSVRSLDSTPANSPCLTGRTTSLASCEKNQGSAITFPVLGPSIEDEESGDPRPPQAKDVVSERWWQYFTREQWAVILKNFIVVAQLSGIWQTFGHFQAFHGRTIGTGLAVLPENEARNRILIVLMNVLVSLPYRSSWESA